MSTINNQQVIPTERLDSEPLQQELTRLAVTLTSIADTSTATAEQVGDKVNEVITYINTVVVPGINELQELLEKTNLAK